LIPLMAHLSFRRTIPLKRQCLQKWVREKDTQSGSYILSILEDCKCFFIFSIFVSTVVLIFKVYSQEVKTEGN
jgi:hypothetical protein